MLLGIIGGRGRLCRRERLDDSLGGVNAGL